MDLKNIKRELYEFCKGYLERRIRTSRQAIEASQQAANNETKSSAGDKYETGRAMAQLEIEKDSAQLAESLKLKNALDKIRIDHTPGTVQPGSLVVTEHGIFFIAISAGKLILDDKTYMAISPASPLAQKMIGLRAGDSFKQNDRTYTIRQIE